MPDIRLSPDRIPHLVRVLFAIQLVSMGAMEMSGPFWPIHLQSLSASGLLFSFSAIAVYIGPMLGILLTNPFWGRIGDRYGHKLMMVRALLGLSSTQLALAFASDVWVILVLRFLQGACAGYIAPAQAYGVGIETPSRRARLFATLQISTNVGSLLGAITGGLILDYATFFWINATASFLCALCAVTAWWILPNVATSRLARALPADASIETAPSSGWRRSPVYGLLGVLGLLFVSRMLTQTPFSLYVSSIFHVRNWLVGACYGALALGFIVSASRWAKYFEAKPLPEALGRMVYVVAACAGLMAFAATARHIGVFITIYFVWGVLLGATTPVLMSLISKATCGRRQGHVLGIAHSTSQFASIAGIAAGGWLSYGRALPYTYFFVAGAYMFSTIAMLAIWRSRFAATADATGGAASGPQSAPVDARAGMSPRSGCLDEAWKGN